MILLKSPQAHAGFAQEEHSELGVKGHTVLEALLLASTTLDREH